MEKVFIISSYTYLWQYAEIGCKVSDIKSIKITRIFDKNIQLIVNFSCTDEPNANRVCFYLSRGSAPSPAKNWKNYGDYILNDGSEATLFASLSKY